MTIIAGESCICLVGALVQYFPTSCKIELIKLRTLKTGTKTRIIAEKLLEEAHSKVVIL